MWGVDGGLVRLGGLAGGFSSRRILQNVGLSVRRGRFLALLKPDNYKGAAALEVVTNFRRPDNKRMLFGKVRVSGLPPCGERVGAMFRGCTLFPRLGIVSGVNFNLGLGGMSGSIVRRGMGEVLGVMKLRNFRGESIALLSNKRRRQITVTETLIGRPGILLLSRPLNTLSTGVHGRVRVRLGGVRERMKVAFVCIARSRRRTLSVSSAMMIVGGNRVRRVNDPASVCGRPRGHFITNFVKRSGVVRKAVVESFLIRFSNFHFRYMSGKFRSGRTVRIILHPRSLSVIRPSRTGVEKAMQGVAFGNIRCRVLIRARLHACVIRAASCTRIKHRIKLGFNPRSVRIVYEVKKCW